MEITGTLTFWTIFFALCIGFWAGIWAEKSDSRIREKRSKRIEDLSDYEKWQRNIKKNAIDGGSSIADLCKHDNIIIQVTKSTTTCETAVEVCADCYKEVSEPKTDCR